MDRTEEIYRESTGYKMGESVQEIDEIWRVLNPRGRFQLFQLFLLVLDYVPGCFAILSAVFTGYIPDYQCKTPPDNTTSQYGNLSYRPDQCAYDVYVTRDNSTVFLDTVDCDEYSYSNKHSYASEWNLVCSKSNLAALAQSLALGGQGIGAFVMSHIADRCGRKSVHVISHIGILVSMAVMALSANIYMLLALRLVAGTFQQGVICTTKTLSLELLPKETRSHTSPVAFMFWSIGIMLLSLYGYLFRDIDWRYLQLGLAAFSLYALIEWWLMEESIRWLLTNGKVDEVRRILKKAAGWNDVNYDEVEVVLGENIQLIEDMVVKAGKAIEMENVEDVQTAKPKETTKKAVKSYTVIDILKNPALRTNTFILWYSWIVITGTYYGLTLVSSHLAGDRFINFFLSGVIEIPAQLASLYLLNKIGRKKTLIMWNGLACLSLIIATFAMTAFAESTVASTIATTFSLIGKSSITGSFSTVFLYTPEIYPTNYRNSGLGISSSISRIGGILAPFASNLALIALWIPGAIFAALCLLSVLLISRLPESSAHELPTTISDCDAWDKK